MLKIRAQPQRLCTGWTRRDLLQAGGAGLLGLSVPRLLFAETARAQGGRARAKSVIFLFLFGGPSQLETWDMKPNAPFENPRAVQTDRVAYSGAVAL